MATKNRTIRTIPRARTPMGEIEPSVRAANFEEVAKGYTTDQTLLEAQRCLYCADPKCVPACPVHIDIPGFIEKLSAQDFRGAYDVITEANLLPAVCGRVIR